MLVESKIQIEEVNLILRYAVQCAELSEREKQALEAFLLGRSFRESAEQYGVSYQAITQVQHRMLEKLRRSLFRLGITSLQSILSEFDESRPEPAEANDCDIRKAARPGRMKPTISLSRRADMAQGGERNFGWAR